MTKYHKDLLRDSPLSSLSIVKLFSSFETTMILKTTNITFLRITLYIPSIRLSIRPWLASERSELASEKPEPVSEWPAPASERPGLAFKGPGGIHGRTYRFPLYSTGLHPLRCPMGPLSRKVFCCMHLMLCIQPC